MRKRLQEIKEKILDLILGPEEILADPYEGEHEDWEDKKSPCSEGCQCKCGEEDK